MNTVIIHWVAALQIREVSIFGNSIWFFLISLKDFCILRYDASLRKNERMIYWQCVNLQCVFLVQLLHNIIKIFAFNAFTEC